MSFLKVVPRLKAPDGSALTCSAALPETEHCPTCHRPTTSVCLLRAVYPDKRCALHTEWLDGTADARRKADNWKGKNAKNRARARAWLAWKRLIAQHLKTDHT